MISAFTPCRNSAKEQGCSQSKGKRRLTKQTSLSSKGAYHGQGTKRKKGRKKETGDDPEGKESRQEKQK
jgi:hypothetical protein